MDSGAPALDQRRLYLEELITRYAVVKDEASSEECRVDSLVFGGFSTRGSVYDARGAGDTMSSDIPSVFYLAKKKKRRENNNNDDEENNNNEEDNEEKENDNNDDEEDDNNDPSSPPPPPHILLEGPAACGKTWLMIKLLLFYARRALDDPSHPIPLFVPAVKLARHSNPTLENYIESICSRGSASRGAAAGRMQFLLEAVEKNNLVLLVDGLDETARYRKEVAEYVINKAALMQPKAIVAARPEIRYWVPVRVMAQLSGVFMGQLSPIMQKHIVSARCSPPCFCSPLLLLLVHPAVAELSRCSLVLSLARQLIADRNLDGLADAHLARELEEVERNAGSLVGGGMLRRLLVESALRELLHAHDARKYLMGSSDFDRDREGDIKLLASTDARTMLEALAEKAFKRDRESQLSTAAVELGFAPASSDSTGAGGGGAHGSNSHHATSTSSSFLPAPISGGGASDGAPVGNIFIPPLRGSATKQKRFFTESDVGALVEENPTYGSIWSVMYKISPLIAWPSCGEGKGYGGSGRKPSFSGASGGAGGSGSNNNAAAAASSSASNHASSSHHNHSHGNNSNSSNHLHEDDDGEEHYFFSYTPILQLLVARSILKKLGASLQEAKTELDKVRILSAAFDDHLLYCSRHREILRLCGIMSRSDVFEMIVSHLVTKDDATLAASQLALDLVRERPIDDRQRPGVMRAVSEVAARRQQQNFLRMMLHPSAAMRRQGAEQFCESQLDASAVGIDLLHAVAKPSKEWYTKVAAAHVLGLLGANEQVVVDALAWLAGAEDEWMPARLEAVSSMAMLNANIGNLVPQLCTGSRVWDTEVADAAQKCLRASPFVNAMLARHDGEEDVCRALASMGIPDSRFVNVLFSRLEDASPQWRALAATCLQQLRVRDKRVVERLCARLRDRNSAVRIAVVRCLCTIVDLCNGGVTSSVVESNNAAAASSAAVVDPLSPTDAESLAEDIALALQVESESDVRSAYSDALSRIAHRFGCRALPRSVWAMLDPSNNNNNAQSGDSSTPSPAAAAASSGIVELQQLLVIDALRGARKDDSDALSALSGRLEDANLFVRVKAAGALLMLVDVSSPHAEKAFHVLIDVCKAANFTTSADFHEHFSARVLAIHTACALAKRARDFGEDSTNASSDRSFQLPTGMVDALLSLFTPTDIDRALGGDNDNDEAALLNASTASEDGGAAAAAPAPAGSLSSRLQQGAMRLSNLRIEALHTFAETECKDERVYTLLLDLVSSSGVGLSSSNNSNDNNTSNNSNSNDHNSSSISFSSIIGLAIDIPQELRVEAVRTLATIGRVLGKSFLSANRRAAELLGALLKHVASPDAALRAAVITTIAGLYPLMQGVDATTIGLALVELVADSDEGVAEEAQKCLFQINFDELRIVQFVASSLAEHCILDISLAQLKNKNVDSDIAHQHKRPNSWRLRLVRILGSISATAAEKRAVELLFQILDMPDLTPNDARHNMALRLEAVRSLASIGLKCDRVMGAAINRANVIRRLTEQLEASPSSALLLELCSSLVRLSQRSKSITDYLLGLLSSPSVSSPLKLQAVHVLLALNSTEINVATGIWRALARSDTDLQLRSILFTAIQQLPFSGEKLEEWMSLLADPEFAPLAFEKISIYSNACRKT